MLNFDPVTLPDSSEQLRPVIRAFIADNLPAGRRNSDFTSGYDASFSAALGEAGWIGMTVPKQYGGSERGYFDRYVVTEELLAAGMPVAAHWITDRQTGPLLMSHGTEAQRERFLPGICAGTVFFSIGMSEPNAGSDLAAIKTKAEAGRLASQRHQDLDYRCPSQSLPDDAGANCASVQQSTRWYVPIDY